MHFNIIQQHQDHSIFFFSFFFQILNHNILVALAVNFPADFTAEVHVAVDKFLAAVAAALADKYR